jgi:hypothetical protein
LVIVPHVCPEPVLANAQVLSFKNGGARQKGFPHQQSIVSWRLKSGIERTSFESRTLLFPGSTPCEKTVLCFECFPYVCPEPVLVK